MTTTPQSMRDAFEAYLGDGADRDDFAKCGDGEYVDPATQADWDLWQASARMERQACSQACYDIGDEQEKQGRTLSAAGADMCSNAILSRALAVDSSAIRGRDREPG